VNHEEHAKPEDLKVDRVFLEANIGNWEQLSDEQKKEIVRRIYDGAVAGLGRRSGDQDAKG
jgi:predicted Fe-S protein YdhL (DUF1289 family)